MKENFEIERINELIDAVMKVARGDYNIQVEVSEKYDHLDALAMGFNSMVDDIRESKIIEQENIKIKGINIQLSEEKLLAEESNRLKSTFISNLSHEIRTPMNGIIGFASLLNEENLSVEKRRQFVNIIVNSSNQLLRIIDDILEISKLETKQVKVVEKHTCLNDILLELFSVFDIRAKENETPLYLKKGLPDAESIILTDKSKLDKILSNLLDNALKFTLNGYVEFGYSLKNNEIELFVKDTGLGIDSEKQEVIFERFSQEEDKLPHNIGGLGLGLSIAKENTELLGGKISLESEKGKGTTFYIRFPYKPENPNFRNSDRIKEENSVQKEYTILIAEDEEINYLYLETVIMSLIKEKTTIIHAKNGLEAFEKCNENRKIDLVFMDLKMPVLNGLQATMKIKEILPDLKIVAQSAFSTDDDIALAKNAGCDDFITKPISQKSLVEVLRKYLLVSSSVLVG